MAKIQKAPPYEDVVAQEMAKMEQEHIEKEGIPPVPETPEDALVTPPEPQA